MTVCVACETEIDNADEEAASNCGVADHVAHVDCLATMTQYGAPCLVCNPEPEPSVPAEAPAPPPAESVASAIPPGVYVDPTGINPEYDPEDGQVYYDAPTHEAGPHQPEQPVAEPGAPDPDETAAATGRANILAASDRLRAAITAAGAAQVAATAATGRLVAAGVDAQAVARAVRDDHPGYDDALQICANAANHYSQWATDMREYEGTAEQVAVADETTAPINDHTANLVAATTSLEGMAVIDIGAGVAPDLTDIGEQNIGAMALGGAGFTGNNLHALTDDLKGWSSIRAEGGRVIIVRWNGAKWQVGATAKHVQTSNGWTYELDKTLATSFDARLVRTVEGAPALVP